MTLESAKELREDYLFIIGQKSNLSSLIITDILIMPSNDPSEPNGYILIVEINENEYEDFSMYSGRTKMGEQP